MVKFRVKNHKFCNAAHSLITEESEFVAAAAFRIPTWVV